MAKFSDQYHSFTGLVFLSNHLEDKCSISLTSSPSEIEENVKVFVSAIILSDIQITLNNPAGKTQFKILNEQQADSLIGIDSHLILLAKMRQPNDSARKVNQLIQNFSLQKTDTPASRPLLDYSKL